MAHSLKKMALVFLVALMPMLLAIQCPPSDDDDDNNDNDSGIDDDGVDDDVVDDDMVDDDAVDDDVVDDDMVDDDAIDDDAVDDDMTDDDIADDDVVDDDAVDDDAVDDDVVDDDVVDDDMVDDDMIDDDMVDDDMIDDDTTDDDTGDDDTSGAIKQKIDDGGEESVSGGISLDIDIHDVIRIYYGRTSSSLSLWYASNQSGEWSHGMAVEGYCYLSGWTNYCTTAGEYHALKTDSAGDVYKLYDYVNDYINQYGYHAHAYLASNIFGVSPTSYCENDYYMDCPGAHNGDAISLAIDENDACHVSYKHATGDNYTAKLAYWGPDDEEPELIDECYAYDMNTTSLALDANGKVHILYFCNSILRHASNETGPWVVEVVDDNVPTPQQSGIVSLVTRNGDDLQGVYFYRSSNPVAGTMRSAERIGDEWAITTLSDVPSTGLSTILDSAQKTRMSFCNSSGLQYAVFDEEWTYRTIDPMVTTCATSIDLDSNDETWIAYTKNGELWIAHVLPENP